MKAMCPKSLETQGLLQKGHGFFQLLETAAGRSEQKLCIVQKQETPPSRKLWRLKWEEESTCCAASAGIAFSARSLTTCSALCYVKSHPLNPSIPSLPPHLSTSHSTPVAHFLTPGNWNKGEGKLVSKGEEGEEGKSSLVWEAVHSECCPCISYSLQNPFVIWLLPRHMPGTTTAKGLRNATACCVAMGIRRQAVNW